MPTGVVLVAFRHDRMNRAVLGKLGKGLGITLFFVCLILVQNVLSRRAKLRLLDLEAALSAARAAIRSSTPETPAYGAGELGVAFAQADRLGGTVYDLAARDDGSIDLMLAVPAGTGVDAAFASVVLRDLYRRQGRAAEPAARVAALLADYDASPLSREVEILCARLGADGSVRGVIAGLRAPVVIDGDRRRCTTSRSASALSLGRAPSVGAAASVPVLARRRRLCALRRRACRPTPNVASTASRRTGAHRRSAGAAPPRSAVSRRGRRGRGGQALPQAPQRRLLRTRRPPPPRAPDTKPASVHSQRSEMVHPSCRYDRRTVPGAPHSFLVGSSRHRSCGPGVA